LLKWLGAEQLCTHSVQSILRYAASAYSKTSQGCVTSCNRQIQYMNSWITTNWIKFSLFLVPTILYHSIKQEVEQIRANVYKRFFPTFLMFCNVFIFFQERLLHLCHGHLMCAGCLSKHNVLCVVWCVDVSAVSNDEEAWSWQQDCCGGWNNHRRRSHLPDTQVEGQSALLYNSWHWTPLALWLKCTWIKAEL